MPRHGDDDSPGRKHKRRKKETQHTTHTVEEENAHSDPTPSPLISLPRELLYPIFVLSSNAHLPLVCRALFYALYHCPDQVKLEWLLHRASYNMERVAHIGIRFPFFCHSFLLNRCLEFEPNITFKNKVIPPYLFAASEPGSPEDQLILQLLERGASPQKPKGYPLIKSAQLGRLDRVKQLIAFGADPTAENNMALRVCVGRRNREMVLYFLSELHLKPDSDTIRVCVSKGYWDIYALLTDYGGVPDMSTINAY